MNVESGKITIKKGVPATQKDEPYEFEVITIKTFFERDDQFLSYLLHFNALNGTFG